MQKYFWKNLFIQFGTEAPTPLFYWELLLQKHFSLRASKINVGLILILVIGVWSCSYRVNIGFGSSIFILFLFNMSEQSCWFCQFSRSEFTDINGFEWTHSRKSRILVFHWFDVTIHSFFFIDLWIVILFSVHALYLCFQRRYSP